MNWHRDLEVVGPELFLRYRKRLMSPGISLEIWRDYPAASLLDIAIRVHAGRQLLRNGQDFEAMGAIRRGHWRPPAAALSHGPVLGHRHDWVSRRLVAVGGLLFGLFCLLSLSDVAGLGPSVLTASVIGLLMAGFRRYTRSVTTPATREPAAGSTAQESPAA